MGLGFVLVWRLARHAGSERLVQRFRSTGRRRELPGQE